MAEQEKKKAETAKKPEADKPKKDKPKGGVTINKKTRSNS